MAFELPKLFLGKATLQVSTKNSITFITKLKLEKGDGKRVNENLKK